VRGFNAVSPFVLATQGYRNRYFSPLPIQPEVRQVERPDSEMRRNARWHSMLYNLYLLLFIHYSS
jgi:hypothetical protein